jgi:hypothetical protein
VLCEDELLTLPKRRLAQEDPVPRPGRVRNEVRLRWLGQLTNDVGEQGPDRYGEAKLFPAELCPRVPSPRSSAFHEVTSRSRSEKGRRPATAGRCRCVVEPVGLRRALFFGFSLDLVSNSAPLSVI